MQLLHVVRSQNEEIMKLFWKQGNVQMGVLRFVIFAVKVGIDGA